MKDRIGKTVRQGGRLICLLHINTGKGDLFIYRLSLQLSNLCQYPVPIVLKQIA